MFHGANNFRLSKLQCHEKSCRCCFAIKKSSNEITTKKCDYNKKNCRIKLANSLIDTCINALPLVPLTTQPTCLRTCRTSAVVMLTITCTFKHFTRRVSATHRKYCIAYDSTNFPPFFALRITVTLASCRTTDSNWPNACCCCTFPLFLRLHNANCNRTR